MAPAQRRCKKRAVNSEYNQHIGLSVGGRTTKIHAAVDGLGNPIHVHLSAGNGHDSVEAETVFMDGTLAGSVVLADKAYGSRAIRSFLEQSGAAYCIPPKSNEKNPWKCDWGLYKERHLVECFFQKLKVFRRIATRYEKLAKRYLAIVKLGCIMIWLAYYTPLCIFKHALIRLLYTIFEYTASYFYTVPYINQSGL